MFGDERKSIEKRLSGLTIASNPPPVAMGELKTEIRGLIDKREAMELEIEAATSRLEAAGVGMHGTLVDKEVDTVSGRGT
jgi:hypothetical protein